QITYIFIDEVQNCKNFEKAVDSLFIKEDTDVYITGSNAYMLSGELATLLSGRYITIDMLPLSFREYYEAKKDTGNSKKELFNDYMKWGSFPYLATIEKNPNVIHPYIEGIYNTILIKDIAKREGITDVSLLESIIKVLMSSIGSPISIKKISDTLNSSGRKISVNTVASYMNALTDSYLFYKVDRYDIKGRQFLKTLGKYYLVDMGIRNLLLSGYSTDLGNVIENITYLELLRRGNKVSIGKLAEKEIDFVAVNSDEIIYYQVAATVLDATTLQRELLPLNRIPDHHRKVLLSLDEIGVPANYEGIGHLNLVDWLLEEE
ncbi:MAG: ATPase, partial [Firmicutes bacterium HGW-Firmicutes-1]